MVWRVTHRSRSLLLLRRYTQGEAQNYHVRRDTAAQLAISGLPPIANGTGFVSLYVFMGVDCRSNSRPSPSGDWAHFIMYYFREDGTLAKIQSQLNTTWPTISTAVLSKNTRAGVPLLKPFGMDLRAARSRAKGLKFWQSIKGRGSDNVRAITVAAFSGRVRCRHEAGGAPHVRYVR
jgi:hypothetical protein